MDGLSVSLFTIQMLIVAFIVFGNTLTIVAVSKFHFLRTVTNMFTVSLACFDLLIATVLPLNALLRYTDVIKARMEVCWLTTIVIVTSVCGSLLTLFAIAIDRYTAVLYPLRYENLMTARRAFLIIAAVWAYTTITPSISVPVTGYWPVEFCAIANLISPIMFITVFIGTISTSILGTTLLYAYIFFVARKHARSIDAQPTGEAGTNAGPANIHQKKVTKMAAIVLGCFLMSWVPFLLTNILKKVFVASTPWLDTMFKFSLNVLYANSFMNPIIYVWKNSMFRVAFKRLLGLRGYNDVDGS